MNFINKNNIGRYSINEIKAGKSHQEVYNFIVANSNLDIHFVAEFVRKIPLMKIRRKYLVLNLVLSFLLVTEVIIYAWNSIKTQGKFLVDAGPSELAATLVGILFLPMVMGILLYGNLTFKRNAHLVSGTILACMTMFSILLIFDPWGKFDILQTLIRLTATILAFYLQSKLVGDYVSDNEALNHNPLQRENVIRFIK